MTSAGEIPPHLKCKGGLSIEVVTIFIIIPLISQENFLHHAIDVEKNHRQIRGANQQQFILFKIRESQQCALMHAQANIK
jgi:hypothetical protein